MEQFINSLPKPVLALLAIAGAVIFFWFANPPHTICDAEKLAQTEALDGLLYPVKTKDKQTIPAKIIAAKDSCLIGNSAGACFDYFDILKKIVRSLHSASSECRSALLAEKDVRPTVEDAIEVMARMAWGIEPPQANFSRFGWFQEAELNLFCRLRNTYVKSAGEEAMDSLRLKISEKLPGQAPVEPSAMQSGQVEPPAPKKATEVFTELEIWDRSIFSVRCEMYGS